MSRYLHGINQMYKGFLTLNAYSIYEDQKRYWKAVIQGFNAFVDEFSLKFYNVLKKSNYIE